MKSERSVCGRVGSAATITFPAVGSRSKNRPRSSRSGGEQGCCSACLSDVQFVSAAVPKDGLIASDDLKLVSSEGKRCVSLCTRVPAAIQNIGRGWELAGGKKISVNCQPIGKGKTPGEACIKPLQLAGDWYPVDSQVARWRWILK